MPDSQQSKSNGEFRAKLQRYKAALGVSNLDLAHIAGVNERRLRRWMTDPSLVSHCEPEALVQRGVLNKLSKAVSSRGVASSKGGVGKQGRHLHHAKRGWFYVPSLTQWCMETFDDRWQSALSCLTARGKYGSQTEFGEYKMRPKNAQEAARYGRPTYQAAGKDE